MPRTRQHQPAQAANAQAYGVAGEQLQAQKMMPLPQTDVGQAPSVPTGGPGPDLMGLAAGFNPAITPLTAPTQRPGEPVTSGLTRGPGPGPEVLAAPTQRASNAASILRLMADTSGDERYTELADKIDRHGGMI